jgi:carbonic anhydrase/acetyltransferase-like protein (isoleucine patch superfamily)
MKKIAESVFLAPGSQVVGDVTIGENSSIWYNAVLRGDTNPIVIGVNTNVQDNAVLHVNRNRGLFIGDNVTIGHGAIVHGCTVGNNVLIGMGSIILDGVEIENNCIIGAGALVTANKVIPEGSMVYGNPAKVIRMLTQEEKESILVSAKNYCELALQERNEKTVEK